jgi:hypothetical protein
MNRKLQELFLTIETQRQSLLLSLRSQDHENLNEHPEGKWSVNQIIAHLISAERLSVNYLTKKIKGVETAADTGFAEELKMVLLKLSQRLPLKFKAPKIVMENTLQENDFHKLEKEWNSVRADLEKILEQVEDRHIRRKIYRHVRVGMINIQHGLQFFKEHVGHHIPQIKKLLKQK